MTDLDRKKLEVQLKRIEATIAELELKVEERKEDINRIEEHIALQYKQQNEIKAKLK